MPMIACRVVLVALYLAVVAAAAHAECAWVL